jgi:hypothetical protein
MSALDHSPRNVLALALFSIGLVATSFAQAATQLAGPRNTIPVTQSTKQAPTESVQLLASRDNGSRCQVARVVHHGHPGKGLNSIERRDVPCGTARLSVR